MGWDKLNFSKNERELIKRYYLAQKEGLKGKFKVKKAKLYREVYNKPDLHGNSANSACNIILRRFNSLPQQEQENLLHTLELEAEKEELLKMKSAVELVHAKNEGKKESFKELKIGFEEGRKTAIHMVEDKIKSIDFSSYEGRLKQRELLYAKLWILLESEDNKAPVIKGLVDLTAEPKEKSESLTLTNNVNLKEKDISYKDVNENFEDNTSEVQLEKLGKRYIDTLLQKDSLNEKEVKFLQSLILKKTNNVEDLEKAIQGLE